MKFYISICIFLFGTILNAQTTVSMSPQKDNTIYSSDGAVSNGQGISLFTGKTNGGVTHRALLKFNIASLVPAGATITARVGGEADHTWRQRMPDRKSTRLNSSHVVTSRMPSSA